MNAETGKSSFPFLPLRTALAALNVGNHTRKEKVSLLPICACKQKANHATSLYILKRSNKPAATRMPRLPGQGCLLASGTRALRCPPGAQELCVPSPSRPCKSVLFLPSPGGLSFCATPRLQPRAASEPGRLPRGSALPVPGEPRRPPGTPSSRLPARPSPCFTERGGTIRRLEVTPALRP